MPQPRSAPRLTRPLGALLIALFLALRIAVPQGFMPAFEHGALAIVACPDAGAASPAMPGHHHGGHHKPNHQPCPYGVASAPGTLADDLPLLAVAAMIAAALVLANRPKAIAAANRRLRPPLRGPPLPA